VSMTPVNVLIVFYSRYGETEKLALAAGVGAIQAHANIRLRRLVTLSEAAAIEIDACWRENLARMTMDYVTPRDGDPAWADVVIFAAPCDAPGEVREYSSGLRQRGGFAGKIAAPFLRGENNAALVSLYAGAAAAGFIVVPEASGEAAEPLDAARAHGRRLAELGRALKNS